MRTLVEIFVLPPFNLIIAAALGLILLRYQKKGGFAILAISLILMYSLSTGFVSSRISYALYNDVILTEWHPMNSHSAAIVILGAGKYIDAPEYGNNTIRGPALERVRYGAFLYSKLKIPILVSGGDPNQSGDSEAVLMKDVLNNEFNIPVKWMEQNARNTYESAINCWQLLVTENIQHIYLVTHYYHMARARGAFERAGFTIIPAPTIIPRTPGLDIYDFIPQAGNMAESANALKEWIGNAWYSIRG